VVDAVLLGTTGVEVSGLMQAQVTRDILNRLRKLLIRNKRLDAMLSEKIAKAEQNQQWTFDFSRDDSAQALDLETQQQLQSHGFDLCQPLRTSASPHSDSIASDVSYHSPVPAQSQSSQVASRSSFQHQPERWAQQQQPGQPTEGKNTIWGSALQPSPGPGFGMSQDLFNQLQGFHQELDAFGMDMSLDSDDFHESSWGGGASSTNQLVNLSPVTMWQQAQNSPFNR
jgi:hypothetical protein